ncbi:KH domain-containing protein [Patescibacteria group bacterium]|nr:KH domain-containing protein [Patescibacteria group bacterium]MBU4098321.1 KH domain-containing protein [Patescibacteria group bacterium]
MKDTLQFIVSSIVDNAEAVHIDEQETDDITNLIITVDKEDMGKIIGKEGKVIRSIRNIMKIKAIKNNKRINISIADSDKK